jgi:hypothetical protein
MLRLTIVLKILIETIKKIKPFIQKNKGYLENSPILLHLRKIRLPLPTKHIYMFWTLELASYLEDAPWPATKDELIDYSIRSGAPIEVVENLQELEDEGDVYETIEDIWPDYPTQDDFLFNEDEY